MLPGAEPETATGLTTWQRSIDERRLNRADTEVNDLRKGQVAMARSVIASFIEPRPQRPCWRDRIDENKRQLRKESPEGDVIPSPVHDNEVPGVTSSPEDAVTTDSCVPGTHLSTPSNATALAVGTDEPHSNDTVVEKAKPESSVASPSPPDVVVE